jgi:hypothetical protein
VRVLAARIVYTKNRSAVTVLLIFPSIPIHPERCQIWFRSHVIRGVTGMYSMNRTEADPNKRGIGCRKVENSNGGTYGADLNRLVKRLTGTMCNREKSFTCFVISSSPSEKAILRSEGTMKFEISLDTVVYQLCFSGSRDPASRSPLPSCGEPNRRSPGFMIANDSVICLAL